MASEQEIFEQVREVLEDALAVDEDEVNMDSTLVDDLGAESIDLLDIVFQLEKKFNIKIDRGELIPTEKLDDPTYVQDGKLTGEGLEMLKKALPKADLEEFSKNPVIQNLAKVLSVKDLVHLVSTKLA
ncbi:MAG: acyl carrier protein [Thermoguttaceae bacterium]|nr:acyl carrier protein [Thermoguttaceae bacterium]